MCSKENRSNVLAKNCQLLKWIGNKQRFAQEIISYFPEKFGTYYEPFLGSGAVLASLWPERAVASDVFEPLIDIFKKLKEDPTGLIDWYATRYLLEKEIGKKETYKKILADFNQVHNGADFIYLSRACYGGVIRFRKSDGYMSTPMGPHKLISIESFSDRVKIWTERVQNTNFYCADFKSLLVNCEAGDMVYLDPPYQDSQSIIYGAHSFNLQDLYQVVAELKARKVNVCLSIDGEKKSGNKKISLNISKNLFKKEIFIKNGRSMLRRFQMGGQTLELEAVTERLLLTY